MVRPAVERVDRMGNGDDNDNDKGWEWRFCVEEEGVQRRRLLGGMMIDAAAGGGSQDGDGEAGYELGWWIKALEMCGDDVSKAKRWLSDWGRRINE